MKRLIALGLSVPVLGGIAFALLGSPAGATEFGFRYFAPYSRAEFSEDQDLNGNDELDPGESNAGEFVFLDGKKVAGHLNFECVRTSVTPPRDLCEGGFKIVEKGVEGTVYLQGIQSASAEKVRVSVLSGTNFFAGATGSAVVKFGRRGVLIHMIVRT